MTVKGNEQLIPFLPSLPQQHEYPMDLTGRAIPKWAGPVCVCVCVCVCVLVHKEPPVENLTFRHLAAATASDWFRPAFGVRCRQPF